MRFFWALAPPDKKKRGGGVYLLLLPNRVGYLAAKPAKRFDRKVLNGRHDAAVPARCRKGTASHSLAYKLWEHVVKRALQNGWVEQGKAVWCFHNFSDGIDRRLRTTVSGEQEHRVDEPRVRHDPQRDVGRRLQRDEQSRGLCQVAVVAIEPLHSL